MKIKLIKLKEAENPIHPNNIEEGYVVEGGASEFPKVGQSFVMVKQEGGFWGTSIVKEILSVDTFRTLNSIYKIEYNG